MKQSLVQRCLLAAKIQRFFDFATFSSKKIAKTFAETEWLFMKKATANMAR